ncbi:MAG: lipopolysaccharide transport periplasmic protein LptA [Burkholderiaceae bacterium]|nr:lipopolysaccharide transport periplasmic protein LptA [Burkholderiaceae bacterium]
MSKFRAFMIPRDLKVFAATRLTTLCVLLIAGIGAAQAEQADRFKPMSIQADTMRYNDLQQTSVFAGNVVVTKGTIVVRGARIEVRQDPEGYQYGVVTAAPGQRASYRQRRDAPDDQWIEGEGNTINYDSRADTVTFTGHAEMRRLVGSRVNDQTQGAVIVYNQTSDTYTVDGNAAGAAPSAGGKGRVRAILTPRQNAAPVPPAPPVPPVPPKSAPSNKKPASSGKSVSADKRRAAAAPAPASSSDSSAPVKFELRSTPALSESPNP